MPVTNILALPLVALSLSTGNNEDWVETFEWVVGPTTSPPELDLGGIAFEMEVRRAPPDNEVILHATTDDGTLSKGAPPDVGFLILRIPLTTMQPIMADSYVGDIVAKAEGYQRRCITFDLTIVEGITR